MNQKEIKETLELHLLWRSNNSNGKRANLSKADLGGADLDRADLSKADLRGANLSKADLGGANLSKADLGGADLDRADLRGANLGGADLNRADLSKADLRGANLSKADLGGADLDRADLRGANLGGANLGGADLSRADLGGANLSRAKVVFTNFPTIKMLSSIYLHKLSDELSLELMRRDAYAHPCPERFPVWAQGGACPYANEDRFWLFYLDKTVWKEGPPQMRDNELIVAICKEKGWKIKGYLE